MNPYGWAISWTTHWSTPISSGLMVSASRKTLSTPTPSLLPPMVPLLNCTRRGRSSVGTLGRQQNPSWADYHGSSLHPRMTGIPIRSVSRPAVVSHLTTYKLSLITQYLQWTHCSNTQFTTQLWWHHSCRHMSRLLK